MAFPAVPNWDSGVGASAWFVWKDPTSLVVYLYQSQAKTIFKRAQAILRQLLDLLSAQYIAFTDQGECFRGSSAAVLPAGVIAEDIYQVSDLTPDGIWDKKWSAALGQWLCISGQGTVAKELALRRDGNFTDVLLRNVIWLAVFVQVNDVADANTHEPKVIPDWLVKRGSAIEIPAGTIETAMVKQAVSPGEDTRDSGWLGVSKWGEPVPNPPSAGGGTRAWPASISTTVTTQGTANTGGLGFAGAAMIALGLGLFLSGGKKRR